jgi:RNA polymerase sigma factor (sigma-70 family)
MPIMTANLPKVKHGHRNARPRSPLTPAQRELAAEAYRLAEPALSKACQRRPKHSDAIVAILSERITTLIPTFDPERASLQTWVINHVNFAVQDSLRRAFNDVDSISHRRGGWNAAASLDGGLNVTRFHLRGDQAPTLLELLPAPRAAGEAEREAAELADYLFQPLPARVREVYRLYTQGLTMAEIADQAGCSESRISQIFSIYRPLLRQRLDALSA